MLIMEVVVIVSCFYLTRLNTLPSLAGDRKFWMETSFALHLIPVGFPNTYDHLCSLSKSLPESILVCKWLQPRKATRPDFDTIQYT